jgi:hypothetical protein
MPPDSSSPALYGPYPAPDDVAPDALTLRASRDLADKPVRFGRATGYVWAEFAEPRRPAIETFVSSDLDGQCTCAAARFPCRHLLALLDRAGSPDAVVSSDPPSWVRQRAGAKLQPSLFPDLDPPHLGDDHWLAAVRAGLAELEQWLSDLLRHGLALLPSADRALWNAAADRLVDAYMPELAATVRELASLPGSGRDWPERLLPRLGQLQLLCDSFHRYESLPPDVQGDLRRAVGMPAAPAAGQEVVRDRWRVLGVRQTSAHKRRVRRVWMLGQESGRVALVETATPERRHQGRLMPAGSLFDATLAFQPSAAPLHAEFAGSLTYVPAGAAGPWALPVSLIDEAVGVAAERRAANPWQPVWPLLVGPARLEPVSGWRLRARTGALLPLVERFGQGWTMLALAADGALNLFGEWDGERFTPLSVAGPGGGWLSLEAWRGVL